INAPNGIPGGIPTPSEFAWRRILCSLCRAAGAALGMRVNLPGGKFYVVGGELVVYVFCLAAK
ncbi:hypothetical protein, partial [Streptomyces sp. NEAU-H33]|uniref:hypothetical protein n=1 Tax=Streptomyces sp. NEAU-H33 TaxID=2979463 RepID=UPI00223EE818